jgi:hypothetical protein
MRKRIWNPRTASPSNTCYKIPSFCIFFCILSAMEQDVKIENELCLE